MRNAVMGSIGSKCGIMITINTVVVIKPYLIYGENPEKDNAKEVFYYCK